LAGGRHRHRHVRNVQRGKFHGRPELQAIGRRRSKNIQRLGYVSHQENGKVNAGVILAGGSKNQIRTRISSGIGRGYIPESKIVLPSRTEQNAGCYIEPVRFVHFERRIGCGGYGNALVVTLAAFPLGAGLVAASGVEAVGEVVFGAAVEAFSWVVVAAGRPGLAAGALAVGGVSAAAPASVPAVSMGNSIFVQIEWPEGICRFYPDNHGCISTPGQHLNEDRVGLDF